MEIACLEIHVGILPKIYFTIRMGKERLCSSRRGGVGGYFYAHPINGPLQSPCSSLGALSCIIIDGKHWHSVTYDSESNSCTYMYQSVYN